jgi:hypothetical protein
MKSDTLQILPTRDLLIEDPWREYSIKIDEDLYVESYIDVIIDNTVPYIECHRKCSAQVKCPYATDEARCKIQQLALRNYFKYAGTEVDLANKTTLVKFTRSAIFYAKFVFESYSFAHGATEEWTWEYMTKLYLRYPFYSSHPVIKAGNRFVDLITEMIPEAYTQKVLFVEGDCEEIIFKKLFMKPRYYHPRFDRIENMKGEGNFRRIELLLKELRDQHCKIHILADGDGQMASTVKRLRKKSLLKKQEYTIFSKAVEDAFPRDMVIYFFEKAMPKKWKNGIIKAAQAAWASRNRSFCKELKKVLVCSGVNPKNAEKILSAAKKKAAKSFAVALDNKIFGSSIFGYNKSKFEILRVSYKLFIY